MRLARCVAALASAIAIGLVLGLAGGASAGASTTHTCTTPKYPGVGYFTSLRVTGVGCATGRKLVVAYYHCRVRHGGKTGRCPGGVMRYRCTEKRNTIPTEIDARVTCRRGSRRIVHTYQQDT
jgi:hypothetical protein